jgi:hypothetical protein
MDFQVSYYFIDRLIGKLFRHRMLCHKNGLTNDYVEGFEYVPLCCHYFITSYMK